MMNIFVLRSQEGSLQCSQECVFQSDHPFH